MPALVLLLLFAGPGFARPKREINPEREAEEREFRKRVDKAITLGAEWLSNRQQDDGSWKHAYDSHFPGGVTALAMLAVLESEVSIWSDTVKKGMVALKKADLNRVYTAGLGIMAMESYRVPQEERKARREGKKLKKLVRKLTSEEKAWMKKRLALIVDGRQRDAWGYPGPPPPNSRVCVPRMTVTCS